MDVDVQGNVIELNLRYNNLNGALIPEIGQLTGLMSLDLAGNNLIGNIPPEIGNLIQLDRLELAYNEFTGAIPEEIGQITGLESISVNNNRFEGCIPDPLRLVENDFRWLDLLFCGFNPSDPDDKAVLVKLYNATNGDDWANNDNWLSDEPLGAWHGVKVDARGQVTDLNLYRNNLKGTLIPEIGQLDQLTWLSLDGNELSGPIPSELSNLNALEILSMSDNELTGQIPVELAEIDKLRSLELRNNAISGTIPADIGNLTSLTYLSLSGNNLSGAIPRQLAGLPNLTDLILASNELTGEFPAWVVDLHSLERLTLGDNQLTGDLTLISEDLEELAHLETFSIAGNDFSGCIPESIRNLRVTDLVFSRHDYCEAPFKQPPIAPEFIKWEIGDAIRAIEARAARLGVQWLFEYAESIGWPIVKEDITVYVMTLEPLVYASAIEDGIIHDGEIESQRDFISHYGGFAREDSNFNKATEEGDSIYSPYALARIVIHENIHTAFQYDIHGMNAGFTLSQGQGVPGPAWFVEGMARYFDVLITSLHGGDADFLRRLRVAVVDGVAVLVNEVPLSAAENRGNCEYICGAFAIELLASIVGQRHIVDFYTMRRPGQTWQQAFEEAFGISVPDFYAMYDQHRAAGFPKLNPPIVPETGR